MNPGHYVLLMILFGCGGYICFLLSEIDTLREQNNRLGKALKKALEQLAGVNN